MPIVLITESLLLRNTAADGRILRDRMLSGFCVRMHARRRTFRVATSVAGKQFRLTLGYWPLMSVDEARARAMVVLAQCRRGERPSRPPAPLALPTLRAVLSDYCGAKSIKASSQQRYESFFRTHFDEWLERPVSDMGSLVFTEHCQAFAQTKGAALVELGRGVVGALIRYVNVMHDQALVSPFVKLAAAGMMPDRAQPRARAPMATQIPPPVATANSPT